MVAALEALDLAHAAPAALVPLLAACKATEARIKVRLATAAPEPETSAPVGPERFIAVKEAAARLSVAPKWLYRRKKTLPFMREVAPGTWRVSVPALDRWMARRGR